MAAVSTADVGLQLVGSQVAFIGVDFQITLRFSNDCVLRFESVFSVTDATHRTTIVDPEGDKARFVPVLRLHGETVEAARIEGSVLVIEFSNNTVLEAGPDGGYESWSYTGPEQPAARAIAMPGGELALWLLHDDATQGP